MPNPSSSKEKVRPVAPRLVEIIDDTVYGDIWERPGLSKRERSMITIAAMIGMRQTDQMRSHMEKGFDNGITPQELGEMITHLAFYAGFPAALSASLVARPLFDDRGLIPKQGQA